MADVPVYTVNKSGQECGLTLDEDSDFLAHLKKLVKQDDLESVRVGKRPAAKKAAAAPQQD